MRSKKKAHLQLQHRRGKHPCPLANKTAFVLADAELERMGCDCQDEDGKSPRPAILLVHPSRKKETLGRDRKHAQEIIEEHNADVRHGRFQEFGPKSFNEWADEWIALRRADGTEDSTLRSYEETLRYARAQWGDWNVDEITKADIRELLSHINQNAPNKRGKLRQGTLDKHRRSTTVCLNDAADDEEHEPYRDPIPTQRSSTARTMAGRA